MTPINRPDRHSLPLSGDQETRCTDFHAPFPRPWVCSCSATSTPSEPEPRDGPFPCSAASARVLSRKSAAAGRAAAAAPAPRSAAPSSSPSCAGRSASSRRPSASGATSACRSSARPPSAVVARGTGPAPCIAIAVAGTGATASSAPRSAMSGRHRPRPLRRGTRRAPARAGMRFPAADAASNCSIRPAAASGCCRARAGSNRCRCAKPLVVDHQHRRTARRGSTARCARRSSRRAIVRLGHFVLQTVDFPRMADWYLRVLGLIPTDVQYLADGSPHLAFCRLDLGDAAGGPSHRRLRRRHRGQVRAQRLRGRRPRCPRPGPAGAARAGAPAHVGHRAAICWAASCSTTGSIPTASSTSTTPTATCSPRTSRPSYSPLEFGGIWAWGDDAPASMKPKKNLRTLLRVLSLLRRKAHHAAAAEAAEPSPRRPGPPLALTPKPGHTMPRTLIRYAVDGSSRWGVQFGASHRTARTSTRRAPATAERHWDRIWSVAPDAGHAAAATASGCWRRSRPTSSSSARA